ncbi:sensor histidine kinase [Ktedonospora formicarum]|uniref:histidine kinase n=1 Tax=Ktedonospora formicarum TaxID=2778364 RepID=A0A8J3I132_9CHLR|nr:HAMP domain-containing sensor histidine kinase [Ktedonospora formicarum]GHO44850.1 hypothetical protein KSX_30130 [Ktedonospora formicarum]
MEGSVQAEQYIQQKIDALQARISELEHIQQEQQRTLLEGQEERRVLEHELQSLHGEYTNLENKLANAHEEITKLQDASQRMDEFLSIASHELRTPLTTINGNIQLAKRRLNAFRPEDIPEDFTNKRDLLHELLSRAERQVRVQNRLVGDLLDVSRIQANRFELHFQDCDLVALLHEVVEDQRAASPQRLINLELNITTQKTSIYADPDRVGQVITNYLTNALKYSAAEEPVIVRLVVNDITARVTVQDRGPGISEEEQARLWQRFYRVPNISVQSGSGVGLGLGLHICRIIVERHGGQVGVASKQGEGSTFCFTLPLQTEQHVSTDDTPNA